MKEEGCSWIVVFPYIGQKATREGERAEKERKENIPLGKKYIYTKYILQEVWRQNMPFKVMPQ